MKISDLLIMCVQNLRRRKFRTMLTVIGVIIGTAAIITMVSLGIGINKANSDLISSWGDLSIIDIYGSWGGDSLLDDDALSKIAAMSNVDAVTPFMNSQIYSSQLVGGRDDRYRAELWSLTGVYPDALEKLGFRIGEGEPLTKPTGKSIPLVLGSDFIYDFTDSKRKYPNNQIYPFDEFGEKSTPFFDPLTEKLTIRIPYGDDMYSEKNEKFLTYEAHVVGILASGESDSWETRGRVYVDSSSLKKMEADFKKANKSSDRAEQGYNQARVRVDQLDQVARVEKDIKAMQLETNSMESYRQQAMEQTQSMQVILGGLAAISLLVATISIANTMVMSVYERTREIGVMKVLGCFVSDIRTIFLVEAAMIGFLGGIIGVGLSYLISFILNKFGGSLGATMGLLDPSMVEASATSISSIPFWLVLAGMGFATIIGILAGVYPAARAVKISALEAIKTD